MTHGPTQAKLLGAALVALLTGSLAGASGLVLCVGTDGHRAVELEHAGTECPTLASSQSGTGISLQTPAECFDLPAAGSGPTVPPSSDPERVPMPPMAFLAVRLEPAAGIETQLLASTDARAGPPSLALHLTSTVLLV